MACQNCTETKYPRSAYYSAYQSCKEPLNSCSTACPQVVDSACVVYTGPQFVNIPLDTNTCIETIIGSIDTMLSATTGNYSSYNTSCLGTQNTQQQFVETISAYVCATQTQLNNFISNTFPTSNNNLQTQITGILNPSLTSCSNIGIVNTDTYTQVFNKIITSQCNIYSSLDLSEANWNSCFTITGTPPTTPLQAVNALIGQICSIKNAGSSTLLPTFDNTNTCIPNGTTTDSLVYTVANLRDITCTKPSFNINALTFGCVTKPSNVATDLQGTIQNILSNVSNLNNIKTTFNPAQFTTVPVDNTDPCKGVTVSLATSQVPADRLVALNNADNAPGTLVTKISQGTGMIIDTTSNPGTLTFNVDTASFASDGKVKVESTDPTAGYLDDKMTGLGDDNGLSINTYVNGSNQVVVKGDLDINLLVTRILEELNTDSDLKAILCSLVASCPVTCAAPTNVTVTTA